VVDLYYANMNVVLTDDGRIEIPRELRERLGFRPGSIIELQSQAGRLVAWKKAEPDVFEKWRGRGVLPGVTETDEYLRLIRDADGR